MTYRVGIIGGSLAHSVSPVLQQAAFAHLGIDVSYEVWETPAGGVPGMLEWLRQTPDVLGANVTVPHKEVVFRSVDRLDPGAEEVGAVNTVVVREGRLAGYNTDVPGFLRGLAQDAGFDAKGARVLLLGAGGAGRAVVVALAQAGAAELTIANRTVPRAAALVELASAKGLKAHAVELSDASLERVCASGPPDLIVNATSMGMRHGSSEHQCPMPAALIPSAALVYDLVYNPLITPLVEAALAAGARVTSGLPMLVYQGAEAFTLWTGKEAPVDVMLAAAREALVVRRPSGGPKGSPGVPTPAQPGSDGTTAAS